ncbi:MAG: ATP-binding cassette domain-containing protein [Bacillota bacterium]
MMIISNYQKQYKKTLVSINHATSHHRITLIKGVNGSGKTTLLKSIANLNRYTGTITVNTPSYYIEETAIFPEAMRVIDYLSALLTLNQIPMDRCQYLLEYFMMTPYTRHAFSALSKGMKQKINLIQSFILPCNCYLLDEPLSGLDDVAQTKLLNLIQAAKVDFVITTHNITPFLILNPQIITI